MHVPSATTKIRQVLRSIGKAVLVLALFSAGTVIQYDEMVTKTTNVECHGRNNENGDDSTTSCRLD